MNTTIANSSNFYEVTVKIPTANEKGRTRKLTRKTLVEASSFGHAETIMMSAHPDYEIISMKLTKVQEVIKPDEPSSASDSQTRTRSLDEPTPHAQACSMHLNSPDEACNEHRPLNRAQRRALEREMNRRRRKNRNIPINPSYRDYKAALPSIF